MGKKVEEQEVEGLLGFNWEEESLDFFGSGVEEKKPEKVETEKPKEELEEEQEKEEEQAAVFFDEESEEEQEEEQEEQEEQSASPETYVQDVYKDFKEKGLLKHVEIAEGEELDFDKLFELQQADYEAEVTSRLETWAKQELDEDAQAFIKFKRTGGSTADFLKTYSSDSEIPQGNIAEEDYQDKVIRYQLRQEGWDSDEIEDRLAYLTESNKKEQVAKRYDKKLKEDVKANKEALLRQAEENKQAIAEQEQVFRDSVKGALDETNEVNGFKITAKDKTELYNFLTKKNNKISDTKSITGFQKKLGEVFQDTSKMVLLAKLIHSDFDMSQFEKATKTKQTQKIKSNLEQRRNLRPVNSGSSSQGSSLAELFN